MRFLSWIRRKTFCLSAKDPGVRTWLWALALASSLTALPARAQFSATVGTAAYLGRSQLGLSYSFSVRHEVGFALGWTPDELIGEVRQYTLEYGYTPWRLRRGAWLFDPMTVGLAGTATDHGEFFFKSAGKYDDDSYYDATVRRYLFRYGIAGGRSLPGGSAIFLRFNLSVLDQGFLILFNNGWTPVLFDFMSPGLSLIYRF